MGFFMLLSLYGYNSIIFIFVQLIALKCFHWHLIQKIGGLLKKYLDYGLMMGFFNLLLVVILKIILKNLYSHILSWSNLQS
jgi:hypothetical protein